MMFQMLCPPLGRMTPGRLCEAGINSTRPFLISRNKARYPTITRSFHFRTLKRPGCPIFETVLRHIALPVPHCQILWPFHPVEALNKVFHISTMPAKGLPEFNLSEKVVLVSGGARGLGLTQAEALLEAGAIGTHHTTGLQE